MENESNFSTLLRNFAKRCNINVERLADLCDVSVHCIYKWQIGYSQPRPKRMAQIVKLFAWIEKHDTEKKANYLSIIRDSK